MNQVEKEHQGFFNTFDNLKFYSRVLPPFLLNQNYYFMTYKQLVGFLFETPNNAFLKALKIGFKINPTDPREWLLHIAKGPDSKNSSLSSVAVDFKYISPFSSPIKWEWIENDYIPRFQGINAKYKYIVTSRPEAIISKYRKRLSDEYGIKVVSVKQFYKFIMRMLKIHCPYYIIHNASNYNGINWYRPTITIKYDQNNTKATLNNCSFMENNNSLCRLIPNFNQTKLFWMNLRDSDPTPCLHSNSHNYFFTHYILMQNSMRDLFD